MITLESKPYAYSTENESRARHKAVEDKKRFRLKSVSKTTVCPKLDEINIDLNESVEKNERKSYIL